MPPKLTDAVGQTTGSATPGGARQFGFPGGGTGGTGAFPGGGGGGGGGGGFGAAFRNANTASHTVAVHLAASVSSNVILLAVLLAVAGGLIAGTFGGWRAPGSARPPRWPRSAESSTGGSPDVQARHPQPGRGASPAVAA